MRGWWQRVRIWWADGAPLRPEQFRTAWIDAYVQGGVSMRRSTSVQTGGPARFLWHDPPMKPQHDLDSPHGGRR